jgi:hypothetical protein
VNVQVVNCPLEIVQAGLVVRPDGPLVKVPKVSPLLNPLPVTETTVPTGPDVGLKVMEGVETVTVKAAVAKSPVLPRTFTVYVLGVAVLATVKLVLDSWPLLEIEHVGDNGDRMTGELGIVEIVQGAESSPDAKPPPLIVTAVPICPVDGDSPITGVVLVTVKVVDATSPPLPVTITV